MVRPTLLVAEQEPGSALSTRKLVLETGKFNVITAHSSKEATELFTLARKLVSALIVTSDLKGRAALISQVKKHRPNLPVIVLSPNQTADAKHADYQISSHEPQQLLDCCRKLFGDPRAIDEVQSEDVTGVTSESRKERPGKSRRDM